MSANFSAEAARKLKRKRMYAKVHAIWAQLRPDLKKGSDDYKEALYMFAEAELKKPQIGSFTELNMWELSKVCEALEREQKQPNLYQQKPQTGGQSAGDVLQFTGNPKPAVASQANSTEPVEHLASLNQRFAVNRLFGYLGWSESYREDFLRKRFRCNRVDMLLHKQAQSCIRILLNCAGSRFWKAQGKEKVSDTMIRAAIPQVKRLIGID